MMWRFDSSHPHQCGKIHFALILRSWRNLAEVAELVYLPAGRQARSKMFYVYILRSLRTGHFYKGLTSNLNKRLEEHLSGKEQVTRLLLPVELVHVEICDNRKEARILEKYLKSGFGREIIKDLFDR